MVIGIALITYKGLRWEELFPTQLPPVLKDNLLMEIKDDTDKD